MGKTGICECGCGETTNIAQRSYPKRGQIKGEFYRFVKGHQRKPRPPISIVIIDGAQAFRIPLTKGMFALVDLEDYDKIPGAWCASKGNGKYYAVQNRVGVSGSRYQIKMHRLIKECPETVDVDHKNGDTLDNRKVNLRLATASQNLMNQQPQNGTSSGYKGVSFNTRTGRWESYITLNGKKVHLGYFKEELHAAKCYDKAAIANFGEFARCNFLVGDRNAELDTETSSTAKCQP